MPRSKSSPALLLPRLLLAVALVSACLAATPAGAPLPVEQPTPPPVAVVQPTTTIRPALPTVGVTQPPTATPEPTPTAQPTPTPVPTPSPTPFVYDPPPKAGKFAMDLYRENAHVRQVTTSMCVPASMQIMINLMSDGELDRTKDTQRELYALARSYSPWLTPERGGASARGWVGGLDQLGYGDFELLSLETMDGALRLAAYHMRRTNKPAGLLVWRGDHAWVMSGFKSTADPAFSDDYEVTAVWIEDPWYGRTDRRWGTGLAPHTLLPVDELRDDFVSWPSRWFQPTWGASSRYVIVAPLS